MDKVLIYLDNGAKNQFIANCETTKDQANDLITLFESVQDLSSVTTAEMFERLVSDPVGYFDAVLRSNVDMKMTGGREPEPATLAKLFGYDRESFVKSIEGLPITETCEGCKTKKIIRKTKAALTEAKWNAYRNYLIFTPSGFELNDEAIELRCESFKTYATTEGQLSIVSHFDDLTAILNKHCSEYEVTDRVKETIATSFHLLLSNGISGDFVTDPEYIKNAIFNK